MADEVRNGAASQRFQALARRLARPAAYTAQEGADALRKALLRGHAPYPEDEDAPPHAVLAAVRVIADARPALADALEDLASSLREREWRPPEPSPFDKDDGTS